MVVQVGPNAGQVGDDGDAVWFQVDRGTDAGQLKQVGGVDRARAEDDLAVGGDRELAAACVDDDAVDRVAAVERQTRDRASVMIVRRGSVR